MLLCARGCTTNDEGWSSRSRRPSRPCATRPEGRRAFWNPEASFFLLNKGPSSWNFLFIFFRGARPPKQKQKSAEFHSVAKHGRTRPMRRTYCGRPGRMLSYNRCLLHLSCSILPRVVHGVATLARSKGSIAPAESGSAGESVEADEASALGPLRPSRPLRPRKRKPRPLRPRKRKLRPSRPLRPSRGGQKKCYRTWFFFWGFKVWDHGRTIQNCSALLRSPNEDFFWEGHSPENRGLSISENYRFGDWA